MVWGVPLAAYLTEIDAVSAPLAEANGANVIEMEQDWLA
jgi:hypothetical protein